MNSDRKQDAEELAAISRHLNTPSRNPSDGFLSELEVMIWNKFDIIGEETVLIALEQWIAACDNMQRDCSPGSKRYWEAKILASLNAIEILYGLENIYEPIRRMNRDY